MTLCALSSVALGEQLPEFISAEHAKEVSNWLVQHAGYRLATADDCKCEDDLRTIRVGDDNAIRPPEPHYEPYYAVGDFDGDGKEDTAFIVVPTRPEGRFLIVVILSSNRHAMQREIKQQYGVAGVGIFTASSVPRKPYRTNLYWGAFGSEGEQVVVPLANTSRSPDGLFP